MKHVYIALTTLLALSFPGLARVGTTQQPLTKLNIADWKQIRAEFERHRHGAFPEPGGGRSGFHARSFEQQWLAHFDGRGFSLEPNEGAWRWGLELAGVTGKAKITTDVNRITYRWSATLDEWYLNGTRGLEHGFTLRAPQKEIRLNVRGGLKPRANSDGVEFVEADGTARMKYTGLAAWDATGKPVPARMTVDAGEVVLTVDDRGTRYPVTIDPIAQQAYLKPSNTDAVDHFGFSVAVSGDTVVVGSHAEDSNAVGVNGTQSDNTKHDSGAAYVFVRNGSTWTQQAYLKASNGDADDLFGSSVAISGDTVVVGALLEDSNAVGVNGTQSDNTKGDSGAAYVFVRNGTTWTQQAYLKASNTDAGDGFGVSVGVSGDTVIVGAYQEDGGATLVNGPDSNTRFNSGAAYVFVRGGTTWTQQAYLKASTTDDSDWFGYSVAVSGDTAVVTAIFEDSNAIGVNGTQSDNSKLDSGAAYVFVRNGTTWSQQAYLKASNTDTNDRFGLSVAMSGETVVVGAYQESSNATGVGGIQSDNTKASSGAAYVFLRSGTTWIQQAYLKASNTDTGDVFGHAIGVSGDTVAVAAFQEDSSATGVNGTQSDNTKTDSGAAYIFTIPPSTVSVTIASSPSGLLFDSTGAGCAPGSGYASPQTFQWTSGATCSVTFGTPQSGAPGTRYVFTNWEDSSTNAARSVTVGASPLALTATFKTQFQLTTAAGAGGTASPASGSYFDSAAVVNVSATPNSGFIFNSWTGGPVASASSASTTVTMDAAKSITANFVVRLPPSVSPILNGTSGLNGWYTSNVSVSWNVTDPQSGISSTTGCDPVTLTATQTLTCTATNGGGLSTTVSITVKIDKSAPTVTGMPGASCSLWPPNHKLVTVATVSAGAGVSGLTSFQVTATSNEPAAPGPDIVITGSGLQLRTVQLRAERLGSGTGRVYTITATSTNGAGTATQATSRCEVAHDQGN